MAGLAYSVYGYADWIARMGVPFTAADEYLYAWAALIGIHPNPATAATGTASFTGNPGTALPSGTPLARQDGTQYETTGNDVVVDPSGNVTAPIAATVEGAFTNCDAGTMISFAAPVPGINSPGITGIITGGADIETNDALRTRMLFKYAQPPQGGATADYIEWALAVPGCTRAWVLSQGAGPGSVVVYPMFDDANAAEGGFPQGTDGCATDETRGPTAAGDQLTVANAIYPNQPVTAVVYVSAPVPYPIDVELDGLQPNTTELQQQIIASLNDIFLMVGQVGGVIWPSDLYEAILATPGIDHFTMAEPSAAIQAPQGALPILGSFTAPPIP
jgi:uncharacterized phage protein gp47/JayE